ncbi:hypothetical protein EBU94_09500, partial [bacterium]|nr:hypothetical protein [bacterium]
TENQVILSQLASKATDIVEGLNETLNKYGQASVNWANRDFGVSVPRCVFNSDKDYMGPDGLPASKCSPPYGYPLYYQRASSIGIPEAGLVGVQATLTKLMFDSTDENQKEKISAFVSFAKEANRELLSQIQVENAKIVSNSTSDKSREELKQNLAKLKKQQEELNKTIESSNELVAFVKDFSKNAIDAYKNIQRTGKKTMKNARKVYDFVKDVAEKHLGKTFLVKIPKACNVFYSKNIQLWDDNDPTFNIKFGPFGFKPQSINSNIGYYANNSIETDINILRLQTLVSDADYFEHYIYNSFGAYHTIGALKNNFNPISEKWEFNYEPEPQGGFFNYSIYNRNIPFSNIQ